MNPTAPRPSPPEMVQPRPFDPACQRWVPELNFPPYRHLPGETPHPHTHLDGHGYGFEEVYSGPPLLAANWRKNLAYLSGVDLYNFAYWWEAHEQWEGLWRLEGARTTCRLYLQGLIQVGAALIKWHQGNRKGMVKLSGLGRNKLERVLGEAEGGSYMGLDLGNFLHCLDGFLTSFPDPERAADVYRNPEWAPLIRLDGMASSAM